MIPYLNEKRFNDLIDLEYLSSQRHIKDEIKVIYPTSTKVPESIALSNKIVLDYIIIRKNILYIWSQPTTEWRAGTNTSFKLKKLQYEFMKMKYI